MLKYLILTGLLASITTTSFAQKQKKSKKAQEATQAIEQREMQKKGAAIELSMMGNMITPMHHELNRLAGGWRMEYTSADGTNQIIGNVQADARPAFEGKYIMKNMNGSYNHLPYTGTSYFGFDNLKNKYILIIMDNTMNAPIILEGDFDKSKQVFNMNGELSSNPLHENGPKTLLNYIITLTSPQQITTEVFMGLQGDELKKVYTIKETR